ncbi:MAG: cytidine/deoxycytidylate deaminase family protein [Desulfobacterales bacterium]|nr:cytidine/deoxycytidylate deaminase family protein [Desulfobacterales bacterium]
MDQPNRPSWEIYFMNITDQVARRSTCLRRAVGAIIVKDRRILTTGYNGAPSGLTHCAIRGCMRETLNVPSGQRHELCWGIHAEQNAIIQAAFHGVSIQGSELFCTNLPCSICAKMIINAGIRTIYYRFHYHDELSADILNEACIQLIQVQQILHDDCK